MCHGDAHHVISLGYVLVTKAIPFIPENYGQPGLSGDDGVVQGAGIIPERHRHSLETQGVKPGGDAGVVLSVAGVLEIKPGPGDLKDCAHRNANSATVERVATGPRQEDGFVTQCSGAAEYGPDVGAVNYPVEDRDAGGGTTGTAAYVFG